MGNDLTIYGDGSSTRDYVHVEDLCRGICNAVDYLTEIDYGQCEIFHISTGTGTTLSSLADIILRSTKSNSKIIYNETRPGEVDKNFASSDKARDILGFYPQIGIEQGITDLVEWLNETHIEYQI